MHEKVISESVNAKHTPIRELVGRGAYKSVFGETSDFCVGNYLHLFFKLGWNTPCSR
jgi:hypothetical protein